VSKFCDRIVNFELWLPEIFGLDSKPLLDTIMLQPLERLSIIIIGEANAKIIKVVLYALKFRSKTLKELIFNGFDTQYSTLIYYVSVFQNWNVWNNLRL
jgi:hypothetical protein